MSLFKKRDEVDYSDLSQATAPGAGSSTAGVAGASGVVWCQSCGGEFRAGSTTTCFDCGGQLGYEPPPSEEDEVEEEMEEVEYDLSAWSAAGLRALASVLDARSIAHVLEEATLVVRVVSEAEVDELLEDVRVMWEGQSLGLEPLALPPGVEVTEHDLAGWARSMLNEVEQRLRVAVVPFELTDEGVLRTPTPDDELVTHVLDAVEFPDALPDLGDEQEERPDLPPAMDVLSDLYVAADRLKGNARDAKAVEAAIAGVEDLVELSIPYGMDAPAWEKVVAEADELWGLLMDGGDLDDIEASAQRLRDLLHPMI